MPSVWAELKRRNIVRIAVAYAVVAWLLIEVAATILPIFEAPQWLLQAFTLFAILGFPVALVLARAYELTPEGMMTPGQGTAAAKSGYLDFGLLFADPFTVHFVAVIRGSAPLPDIDSAGRSGNVEILRMLGEPEPSKLGADLYQPFRIRPGRVAELVRENHFEITVQVAE